MDWEAVICKTQRHLKVEKFCHRGACEKELTREAGQSGLGSPKTELALPTESVQLVLFFGSPQQPQPRCGKSRPLRSSSGLAAPFPQHLISLDLPDFLKLVAFVCFLWWTVSSVRAETCLSCLLLYLQLLRACGFVMWTWWKYGGEREFNVLGREFLGCWTMESEPQRKKVKREAHRSVWRTGVLEINKKSWKYMIVSRDWNISFYKFKGRAIGEPQSPRCSHWSGELQWHRRDCHWGWRGHGYFMAWDTDVEDFTEIF